MYIIIPDFSIGYKSKIKNEVTAITYGNSSTRGFGKNKINLWTSSQIE